MSLVLLPSDTDPDKEARVLELRAARRRHAAALHELADQFESGEVEYVVGAFKPARGVVTPFALGVRSLLEVVGALHIATSGAEVDVLAAMAREAQKNPENT